MKQNFNSTIKKTYILIVIHLFSSKLRVICYTKEDKQSPFNLLLGTSS